MRTRSALGSSLLLVVYMASLALVCSFILFEVLDIDGSDFPTAVPRSVTAVKLSEPPHDLKRVWAGPPSLFDSQIPAHRICDPGERDPARVVTQPPVAPTLAIRGTARLARSSLDAPSA